MKLFCENSKRFSLLTIFRKNAEHKCLAGSKIRQKSVTSMSLWVLQLRLLITLTVKILQKLKIIENKSNIPPPPLAGLVGPKPGCPPPDKLALLNSG